MWEILPFATILGGAGFGELLRKYIYVSRRGEVSPTARPRIQVSGPKVQPLICQICLGRIKEGTQYVRCGSGRVFHSVCLDRVGNCPYCQRTIEIKGLEGMLPPPSVAPAPPLPILEPTMESDDAVVCPVCGSVLDKGATVCPCCEAIFVDPNGTFKCPECMAELKEGDLFCGRCGREFQKVEMPHCPNCGVEVSPNAEVCSRCGCLLHDRCPECGGELADEAVTCPTCGADFEFV